MHERISLHARLRMEAREVLPPTVAAVLRSGRVEPGTEPGTYHHELCGYQVILSVAGVVVTVMRPNPTPARYSPKRAARRAGQERRRWERTARRERMQPWASR
ncbi:MAG: hypothetical protein AB7D57_07040 [Desulfovibrionaceae bacterium]